LSSVTDLTGCKVPDAKGGNLAKRGNGVYERGKYQHKKI
jgi:hypothetical protein